MSTGKSLGAAVGWVVVGAGVAGGWVVVVGVGAGAAVVAWATEEAVAGCVVVVESAASSSLAQPAIIKAAMTATDNNLVIFACQMRKA